MFVIFISGSVEKFLREQAHVRHLQIKTLMEIAIEETDLTGAVFEISLE